LKCINLLGIKVKTSTKRYAQVCSHSNPSILFPPTSVYREWWLIRPPFLARKANRHISYNFPSLIFVRNTLYYDKLNIHESRGYNEYRFKNSHGRSCFMYIVTVLPKVIRSKSQASYHFIHKHFNIKIPKIITSLIIYIYPQFPQYTWKLKLLM
jgi:hypothetical protein